ncbi:MAG: hypothetical protein AAF652_17135, partial [Cyanobacteria bacterium P01_C01_bin.72]
MLSNEIICAELERHDGFISTVELSMELDASAQELRDSLFKLGDRVMCNKHDEWRIVRKLEQLPLTEAEIRERDELEKTVQQAFYVAGSALKTLRDKRLYRETHSTFEKYVRDRFDFTRTAAYYLIKASIVVDNLKCQPLVDILPTSERQCREIAKLPVEQQSDVWSQAVKRASGIPSARIIKQVVQEIRGEEPDKMFEQKKDGIVQVPGIGNEYVAVLDEQTYWRIKK